MERPILFSAPMVRALLAGTKTQTRRVVKPQPAQCLGQLPPDSKRAPRWWFSSGEPPKPSFELACPYGVPGDTLWVREGLTLAPGAFNYAADGSPIAVSTRPERALLHEYQRAKAPGIHMPRWACRIVLKVAEVRVERLNEITEAAAKAEGIVEYPCIGPHRGPNATFWSADGRYPDAPIGRTTPVAAYKALWEEINGEDGPTSWAANPWVWAVSFERTA